MKAIAMVSSAILISCLSVVAVLNTESVRAARSAAPSRCANIQLFMRAQRATGAAGTIGIIYRLHNMWGSPCMLYGYPGVELLNRNFNSLPTTTYRGGGTIIGSTSPRTIILSGGGNAYFALSYSDASVGNRPCQAAAHYVMVIPPNGNLPIVDYAGPHGGVIHSCTGSIHVSPVESGPRF